MKKSFIKWMRKLYDEQEVSQDRLRNFIRIYAAGLHEGLRIAQGEDFANRWLAQHAHFFLDKDWQPDKSWQWWRR